MADTDDSSARWERNVLEKVALSAVEEQRRARRWGIFFKLLSFAWLFLLLFALLGWMAKAEVSLPGKHSAMVELDGVIAPDSRASADLIVKGLRSAFEDSDTAGVILRINSPGGSAVQAAEINDAIRGLRKEHPNIPLYAVVDDECASGAYYVAVAADKIFVNKASLVGSIGVLIDGFGFTGAMHKLGIERRLLTAGVNKGFLDPFSPLTPQQRAYAEQMLREVHEQFIAAVKEGRGARLKQSPELFSGLVWTGATSVGMGLADGFGSIDSVARDVIKAEHVVDFTPRESVTDRFARLIGADTSAAMPPAGLELRAE